MSAGERAQPCRICRRGYREAEMDRGRWCMECREAVIRRATLWGRGVGGFSALALALWIVVSVATASRFLVLWVALVAGTYLFVAKFVRRLAFDLILNHRSRAKGEP